MSAGSSDAPWGFTRVVAGAAFSLSLMMRLRAHWVALVASLALAPLPVAAQDLVARGLEIFMSQGGYGCHTVGVAGTPIGPDLSRVGFKYPRRCLEEWLRDPAAQKPTAHMPRISLTEGEVTALAAFLSSLQ